MKEFILDRKHFNEDDWLYCVTARPGWDKPIKFEVADDCIRNRCMVESNPREEDYEFISVISKETFEPDNLLIELDCKFDSFGAPCIVYTDDWYTDQNTGYNVFRTHYEFCGYVKGLNIWDYRHGGNNMMSLAAARSYFPVEENKKITMRGILDNGRREGTINGMGVNIPLEKPKGKIHIGFTACEGLDSFYALRIGKLHD